MGAPWEPRLHGPMVDHVRRSPLDAREVETSVAAGEQALQALLQCTRDHAGTLEAHEAEQGLFTRRWPLGWAALKRYVAERGTGDLGAAITRADGVLLPREQPLRGRDDCSRFGTLAVARPCDRPPGEAGIGPLDVPVNRPERGDSYVLQVGMTVFAVEPPFQERAGFFAHLVAREVAERVLMAVAQEAPADDEGFAAPRPVPPEDMEGERLGVRVDGKGVPRLREEAVTLKAQLGTGEKRQTQQEALGGVSDTIEAKPRSPAALAERLAEPEAARARRPRDHGTDDAPRAQQSRRLASLGRTTQAGMARLQADAERRDPQPRTPWVLRRDGALGLGHLATRRFKAWTRVTWVLDILPVGGDLWAAAHACCREGSPAGHRWVQAKLTALLRDRVGSVIGGLRQLLTTRQLRRSGRGRGHAGVALAQEEPRP